MTTLSRTRTLALAGLVAPVWFTAMVVIQGELHPRYSHVTMPISALAAWPMGWMQNLTFYVVIAFVIALHRSVRQAHRGRAGHVLLLIAGAALAMNAVFPWEIVDGVPAELTTRAASAITTFLATALGMIVFSRGMTTDVQWRGLARYTRWSRILVLVLFLVLGFFAIEDSAPLHRWIGLIQRVLVAVCFVWMIVVALRITAARESGLGTIGFGSRLRFGLRQAASCRGALAQCGGEPHCRELEPSR
jgi:hypothetical protein